LQTNYTNIAIYQTVNLLLYSRYYAKRVVNYQCLLPLHSTKATQLLASIL